MDPSYRSLAAQAIRSKDSSETKSSAEEAGLKPNVTLSDISFELDSEARKRIEAERLKAREALGRSSRAPFATD